MIALLRRELQRAKDLLQKKDKKIRVLKKTVAAQRRWMKARNREFQELESENEELERRLIIEEGETRQEEEQRFYAERLLSECRDELAEAAAEATQEQRHYGALLQAMEYMAVDEEVRVVDRYREQQLAATRDAGHWTVRVSHRSRVRDPRPFVLVRYERTRGGPHDQLFHFSSVDSVYLFLAGLERASSECVDVDAIISIYQPHYKLFTVAEALQECVGGSAHSAFPAPVREGLFRYSQGRWVVRPVEVAKLRERERDMDGYERLLSPLAPRTLEACHFRRRASVGQETAQIVYDRHRGQVAIWRE